MSTLKLKITNKTNWYLWRNSDGTTFPASIANRASTDEIELKGNGAVNYHLNWPAPGDRHFGISWTPHGEDWIVRVAWTEAPLQCIDQHGNPVKPQQDIYADLHIEHAADKVFRHEFIVDWQVPPTVPVPVTLDVGVVKDVSSTNLEKAIQILKNIEWSCERLATTRQHLQELQQRCMAEVEDLRKLKLLAEIEVNRLDAQWRIDKQVRGEAEARRLKVVATMDELIESAAKAMLSSPVKNIPILVRDKAGDVGEINPIRGSLLAQFEYYAANLCYQLKDKTTFEALYKALEVDGDKPVPGRRANLVQAACQIAAQAAYWVGDGAKLADAESILGRVIEAKRQFPEEHKAQNVLELLTSLAFAPGDWAACQGPEPFSLWGTVLEVYMSVRVSSAAKAKSPRLLDDAKDSIEKALKDVLIGTGALPPNLKLKWDDFVPFFKLVKEGREVKARYGEAGEILQTRLVQKLDDATESDGVLEKFKAVRKFNTEKQYKEAYNKLVGFSEPENLFPSQLDTFLQRLQPIWKAFKIFGDAKALITPLLTLATLDPKKQNFRNRREGDRRGRQ